MCVCVCVTKEQRREGARGAEQEGDSPALSKSPFCIPPFPSLPSTSSLSSLPSRTCPHSSPPSSPPSPALSESPFCVPPFACLPPFSPPSLSVSSYRAQSQSLSLSLSV
eukprot:3107346-Rhodomonas_salina.1